MLHKMVDLTKLPRFVLEMLEMAAVGQYTVAVPSVMRLETDEGFIVLPEYVNIIVDKDDGGIMTIALSPVSRNDIAKANNGYKIDLADTKIVVNSFDHLHNYGANL